jgi:hypothetical protein
MSWFRRTSPLRQPHPDGGVEAELQRVIGLQRAVARTEARIEDIRRAQVKLDHDIRSSARDYMVNSSILERQAKVLREEREALEAQVRGTQEEVSRRLAALGTDASLL